MALNIYIYGSPKGFQTTVEKNSSLSTYFEQLYITSRRGRRLMVNRNKNGETSYNYLVYDIIGNRPNAFFGMSFILTNNQYVDDFATIYSIFDKEFEEIIKRHRLIRQTEDNTLQYCAFTFDSVSDEIERIQNSILVALRDSGIAFSQYDNTFANTNTSKIVLYNNATPKAIIQGAFRKVSWIAISPKFVIKENDNEDLEVSLYDIDQKYKTYLSKLTDIAINRNPALLPDLNEIVTFVKDTRSDIMKYAISLQKKSQPEAQVYFDQAKLLSTLADQANALREQISNADQINDKLDRTEGNNIPEPKDTTRKCPKCGKTYDVSEFPQNSEFCAHCIKSTRHNPTPSIIDDFVDSILNSPKILAAIVLLIIVGAGAILLNKIDPSPEQEIVGVVTKNDSIQIQEPNSGIAKLINSVDSAMVKLEEAERSNQNVEEITIELKNKRYDTALNLMHRYSLYNKYINQIVDGCTQLINSKNTTNELEKFKDAYPNCIKISEIELLYNTRYEMLNNDTNANIIKILGDAIAVIFETDDLYNIKNSVETIRDSTEIKLSVKKYYIIKSNNKITLTETSGAATFKDGDVRVYSRKTAIVKFKINDNEFTINIRP